MHFLGYSPKYIISDFQKHFIFLNDNRIVKTLTHELLFKFFIRQEIHVIVSNLKTRCALIDWVKVISNDLVLQFAEHYQQVRRATFVFVFQIYFMYNFSLIDYILKNIHFIYMLI